MRVVFMGSPDFAVPALEALVDAGHEVTCVYCQPPRPAAGRLLRGLRPLAAAANHQPHVMAACRRHQPPAHLHGLAKIRKARAV